MSLIYKIVPCELWEMALHEGVFHGAPVDLADGFIHFSSVDQVQETCDKHFAGQRNLLLVAIEEEKLADGLKWEESRGGALFPHYYGTFSPAIASSVTLIKDMANVI